MILKTKILFRYFVIVFNESLFFEYTPGLMAIFTFTHRKHNLNTTATTETYRIALLPESIYLTASCIMTNTQSESIFR